MKDIIFLKLLKKNKLLWNYEALNQSKSLEILGYIKYIHELGYSGQFEITEKGNEFLKKGE